MTSLLTPSSPVILAVGDLVFDLSRRELAGPMRAVPVPPGLCPLLRTFMQRPGTTVSHGEMIGLCWPDPDAEPDDALGAVRERVRRVRQLLEDAGAPGVLHLVFLEGYRLRAGERRVVRILTPAEAVIVDQVLAARAIPAEAA